MSYYYFSLIFLVISLTLYALARSIFTYPKDDLNEVFSYTALRSLKFTKSLLPGNSVESLLQLINLTKAITLFTFYTSGLLFVLIHTLPRAAEVSKGTYLSIPFSYFLFANVVLALITLCALALCSLLSSFGKKTTLKITAFPGSVPLLLLLPLTYPILFFQKSFTSKIKPMLTGGSMLKKQLLDILDSEQVKGLDSSKKHLIYSFAHFEDKTCREIMIPRIKLECLQSTSSIFEAIALFIEEGFSRLPIFEKSIDHITGVLLYKDVLEYTFKKGLYDVESLKRAPITSLISPILYAPENKHISDLLQVMRSRKIHGAIIVNEYGCTEGLVTIEDIFEELIGSEILDEHDEEDDLLYRKTHDEGWIVEANISIIDAEREFGIILPHNPEYETIGGFISTTMGIIPKPGSVIHFDQYEIKVLSSNERKILKVKITVSSKQPK